MLRGDNMQAGLAEDVSLIEGFVEHFVGSIGYEWDEYDLID